MSLARLKPFYVSLAVRNNAARGYTESSTDNVSIQGQEANNYIVAQIEEDYNEPIAQKASDYLVAVERMELDMHAIPFYNTVDEGSETIIIRSRVNTNLTTSMLLDSTVQTYNLPDLLNKLSTKPYTNPNNGLAMKIVYDLSKEGYARITVGGTGTGTAAVNFNNLQIEFPARLNMILGIAVNRQLVDSSGTNPLTVATSTYPRVGLGDYLDHILIRTNLPTYSDSLGNEKIALLTDFGVPMVYQSNLVYTGNGFGESGWTMPVRDKLIYYPQERRYMELNGDFPINNIYLQALFRTCYGTYKPVILPYGGAFEVKLGFYLRQ